MTVMDSFRLDGKVALVTGAAGLFGRQIARALGQAAATLYMASRNVHGLRQLADQFAKEGLRAKRSGWTRRRKHQFRKRWTLSCARREGLTYW